MTGFILGIDQGNTHTRAVVADLEGHLLSLGLAEGACHAYVGMERAMHAIHEATNQAVQRAGVRQGELVLIMAGVTGADWADEYPLLEGNIRQLGFCETVKVLNDAIIALRGGTAQPYGVILIAGSGGNCAVRAPDGREFIYGYYQEWPLQGGDGLGRQMLSAIYRAHTGREPATSLTQRALEAFRVGTVDDLLRADVENRLPAEGIRDLAPALFDEGAHGDELANRIIRAFGEGYAELAVAALRRFGMTGIEVEVVLSGSIFKAKGSLLIEAITAGIQAVVPRARLVNARYEPVVGAVLLGLEHLGIDISGEVQANLEQGAQRLDLVRHLEDE